jgi:DNA-binding MarR family transcriptional regulator
VPDKPPVPEDFLERVEFRDAAMLSFVTSGIIVPAYDAVKRDFGIIRAEYLLLLCLAHYPVLTAQDVSRITGRPRNSISRAVHRMLKEGYLTRVPDPDDKRQAKLAITNAGRDMHDKIAAYLVEKEVEVLGVLEPEERARFLSTLRKLVSHAADLQR